MRDLRKLEADFYRGDGKLMISFGQRDFGIILGVQDRITQMIDVAESKMIEQLYTKAKPIANLPLLKEAFSYYKEKNLENI